MEKEGHFNSFEEAWEIDRSEHSYYFIDFIKMAELTLTSYIFTKDRIQEFKNSEPIILTLHPPESYKINRIWNNDNSDKSLRFFQQSILLKLWGRFEFWLKSMISEYILIDDNSLSKFFTEKQITEISKPTNESGRRKKIKDFLKLSGDNSLFKKLKQEEFKHWNVRYDLETMETIVKIRHDSAHEIGKTLDEFLEQHYAKYEESLNEKWERFLDDFLVNALVRFAKDLDKALYAEVKKVNPEAARIIQTKNNSSNIGSIYITANTAADRLII